MKMENRSINNDFRESDCCSSPLGKSLLRGDLCPVCSEKGLQVKADTIRALTRRQWSGYDKITDGYFCTNPEDSTAYFIPESELVIDKADLKVRVGLKEKEEPITVCYCFQHTKSDIEQDFAENVHSTIEDEIREKVKNNQCSCETMNPKGRCCLGDVRSTYLKSRDAVLAK